MIDPTQLTELARLLTAGEITATEFLARTEIGSVRLSEATVDIDRRRRCGFPEVVFGPGKSPATVVEICQRLAAAGEPLLVTRVDADQAAALQAAFSGGEHNVRGRTFRRGSAQQPPVGRVAVVTAGTSDLPVAEEALETLAWMGIAAHRVTDVGVAGPHRLPERLAELQQCDAVVVVAGMEGALPGVVGGHVDCPVIGVPTSVGYGAHLGGIAPLLSMLNSCAANVTVVNIDAGFKAGYVAGMIAERRQRPTMS